MKFSTKIIAGAVVALSLAAAGLSYAQPGGRGWGMGPGMMGGYGGGYGMGGGMFGGASPEAITSRMADLKAQLQITPAQDTAWAAFESQAQQEAASTQALHNQMFSQMHGPQAGNADFNALHDAMFKLRQANWTARSAALKDLYAVLSPEQQALADQQLAGGGCGAGAGYGMGYGRGFGGRVN